MHRFLHFKTIGHADHCDLVVDEPEVGDVHARVALRADGSLWLLENDAGCEFFVDRGAGWVPATRLRLCAGDRIRLGHTELVLEGICRLFDLAPAAADDQSFESAIPGVPAPVPISAPARATEKPWRNPGTGQVEKTTRDNR